MIVPVLRLKKETRPPSFCLLTLNRSQLAVPLVAITTVFISLFYATATVVSSLPTSTETQPENTCVASCSIKGIEQPYRAGWGLQGTPSATVTAENVIEIVNLAAATTRTVTHANTQASLPTTTNSDGTVTRNVTYFLTGETYTTNV